MKKLKQFLETLALIVWEPIRRILRNEEPAVAAGAVGIAVNLLGHYNLHLSADYQAWLMTVVLGFITWLVRQQVVPGSKLPDATTTITYMWHILQQQIIDKAKTLPPADDGKKMSMDKRKQPRKKVDS